MTVKEITERVIKKTGVEPLPEDQTCDLLMAGDWNLEVKSIVSTFMATVEVIEKTIDIGANMIITHEPTWFTGKDNVEWLLNDPVYLKKKQLIEDHGLAIWRFHDHMHMAAEDGIYRGFDIEFDWAKYKIPLWELNNPPIFENFGAAYHIPETSLEQLCRYFKEKLDMDVVQIVGNPRMKVERVGVLVGGGSLGLGIEEMPMQIMHSNNLDLLICGDITEWTLSAYVRDAAAMGFNKGMMILGHERTEEPGMKHLGDWLKDTLDGTEVIFIDSGEPFKYIY
jgi:putative NIF3 family GTP cyclohydrolase 1 type 2